MFIVLVMFLLAVLVFLGGWCYLCYRLGTWLVGRCQPQARYARPEFCRAARPAVAREAPRPAPAPPAPAATPRCARRPDRPSSVIAIILALLLGCLAILGLKHRRVNQAFTSVVGPAAAKPAADKVTGWTITGRGKTTKDAEQVALDDAYGTVLNYVDRELMGPRWAPTQDYVNKRLVKSKTPAEAIELAGLGPVEQVVVRVEVGPEEQKDMLRRGRMLFLFKLLGAAVVVLGAIAAYVRVDEYSKGYYTGWLRLATLAVVAGVIFGLVQAGTFSFTLPAPNDPDVTPPVTVQVR